MQRHHKRHKRRASLNLVSLMDIFTILVFFLLVNSSDVEVLPNARDVALPESIAESRARETVVVLVTDEAVLVQGQPVARVADIAAREAIVVPELKAALEEQTRRTLRRESLDDAASREVTIMGDKAIPYSLLKKIMATCTAADYGRVSLAVLQKASDAVAGTVAARGR
ncbi:MAG: biopolymer transporter ExbD [Gammaproteobacteria bacterium]|nr:biopolymer transporter ExbD [Gammaproteobacteria bacterium]